MLKKNILMFLVITSQFVFANDFQQFDTENDSILRDHKFSIENFNEITDSQQKLVFSSKLFPGNSDIKEIYYPVWSNKSMIFLARTNRGAYRFLEYKINQENYYLEEMKLSSADDDLDLFADDLMIPKSLDEPPLRDPVINNENDLVAFLITDFNAGITKVCIIDSSGDNVVNILHYSDNNEIIRSLDWYDESNLIFIKSKVSESSDIYKLNIKTKKVDVLISDYDDYSYSYNTGEIICSIRDSFESKLVYYTKNIKKKYELDIDGEISRLAFNPNGSQIAFLNKQFNQYDLKVLELQSREIVNVNDLIDYKVFYTDVGAIYLDYTPVWDNYDNIYFAVGAFDFANLIYRYNVIDREVYEVYDFSDKFKSISAFDISKFYFTDNKGGSQLVICGLEPGSRNRTAELFFLNKNSSGE